MNLIVFIAGLSVCLLAMGLFLYIRLDKGGVAGLFTKTLASFCFVAFAVLLSATKMNVAFYGSWAVSLLILGLVCGLIGDIVLDLKVIYPFHQDKYLVAGMSSFGVGHLFYILAAAFLINNEIPFFTLEILQPILYVLAGTVVVTLLMWFASVKIMKLKYGKFTWLVNLYTAVLVFITAVCAYFAFVLTSVPMFVLAIAFIFFLFSDLILSKQYFGGRQDEKSLIFVNHLTYYFAQILIAMFIYFV